MGRSLWEEEPESRGMDRMPRYLPTFKKAILVHVAVDVDVLAGSKRELCLWVLVGALEGVIAVGGRQSWRRTVNYIPPPCPSLPLPEADTGLSTFSQVERSRHPPPPS